MSTINQKEYLRKYLGIGKAPGEKKKKKKLKSISNKITIIDDDIDQFHEPTKEELIDEDAPQIVAIIDERPLQLRTDDETKQALWEPVGNLAEETPPLQNQALSIAGFKIDKNLKIKEEIIDISPPRRRRDSGKDDQSSQTKNRMHEDDLTPPRRNKSNNKDISPERRKPNRGVAEQRDSSPKRRKRNGGRDSSPPRASRRAEDGYPGLRVKQEKEDSTNSLERMEKTLDGKTAGLQNARELVSETREMRRREDELFSNIPSEVSGQYATTMFRKRTRGKIREDDATKRKKQEEEDKQKEKYMRWGRGLAQVETRTRQIEDEMHEMSKPIARYADDEDLENYLKGQEREGDPMLAYIRSKKRKDDVKSGKPMKPAYEGEFMPNRFGIRPGYRWDGVDRSTGYEKKWFEVQTSKRAQQEEAFKWSSEDL